jgi:hypothetical protein
MRRRGFLGWAAAAGVLLAAPAHKPPHPPHPHATTTTREPMPTSTTVRTTLPQGPITIVAGGVYRGWWRSTDPATPAVTIATTQPVTIDRSLIDGAIGVYAQNTIGTDVTVTNTRLLAVNPGSQVDQHACYLRQPASLIFEHNLLVDGHGVLLAGEDVATTLLRIRYNDFVDVGRYPKASLTSAIQFDKVSAPNGALVSWNRVVNHRGRSSTEDVINMYQSNGASGQLIEIDHNLIDGSYPYSGDGAGFTGGGIDLGDSGGSYQVAHDNTVVRITNNGLMIPAGSNLEHYANRVVHSGIADDGVRVSSTFGNGLLVWDNPSYPGVPVNATAHDTSGDHRRWNGSAWERHWQNTPACDPSGGCTNNTNLGLSLTDDAAWLAEINDALADWETARVAAGVTVGVLP